MSPGWVAFEGFALEDAIASRARSAGIALPAAAVLSLAEHARAVMIANERLHLTTIVEPEEFVERHLGETFEGAAMLEAPAGGTLLDLGSGNGYPGLPLAACFPSLTAVLAEASVRKAEFLAEAIRASGFRNARVLARQVQRAGDLAEEGPFRLVATRAAGGWAKILPKLASTLAADGELLVWAGDEVEAVRRRVAWRRYELVESRPLPGRERSWVWRFRTASRA
jgi:16S rRNA (guanine527-N7)-methyltransferase